MADVLDVAKYALDKLGYVSTMKLQKIVFYSHAYHLVKHGTPLFSDRIEAWVNGPVVRSLFQAHRGQFIISAGFFGDLDAQMLTPQEKESIDHVIYCIGDMSGADLSNLTHSEDPWKVARGKCDPDERSNAEIKDAAISAFYIGMPAGNPVFA